ncbi:MAG TPA: glycosyltransferase family 39 protein [Chloroflexota bacterium]|nr:glycosyltransferase family 39 protein [Chloroflexota bacterium]
MRPISRNLYWLLAPTAVFLMVLGTLQEPHTLSIDAGAYIEVGWRLLHGAVPYRDLWDHKPPGIYFLNALALRLFAASPAAIHLFEAAWNVLAGLAFYSVARTFFDAKPALLSTVAFALFLPLRLLTVGGDRPETFLVLPATAAYACLFEAMRRDWPRHSPAKALTAIVASGFCLAVACLLKPTESLNAVVLVVTYAAFTLRERGAGTPSRLILGWCGLLLGAGLPVLATAGYFYQQQALQELVAQAIVYNSYYVRSMPLSASLAALRAALYTMWPQLELLFVLAPLGIIFSWLSRSKNWLFPFAVVGWLGAEVIGAGLGERYFLYYFVPTIPPLVLMSSLAGQELFQSVHHPSRAAAGPPRSYLAVSLVILTVMAPVSQSIGMLAGARNLAGQPIFSLTAESPEDSRLLAEIQGFSSPTDTVFVWGARPDLYFLSSRTPASRFIYIFPVLGSFGGLGDENYPAYPQLYDSAPLVRQFMSDLRTKNPRVIVVEPRFSGSIRRVTEFQGFLAARYVNVANVEGWDIYQSVSVDARERAPSALGAIVPYESQ